MSKAAKAFLMLLVSSGVSIAQERTSYSPLLELGERTSADLRIIEEGPGATLDLCFAYNVDTTNGILTIGDYDRVVVPLKVNAGKYTGTAVSSEAKRAVAVNLERKGSDKSKASFTGTVTIDGKAFQVSAEPVFGKEAEEETVFVNIAAKPESFDEALAPNVVGIKFRRGSLPQLLDALRPASVRIDITAGATDKCAALRSNAEYLRVLTPPEESPALVANLKKLPFVIDAGWSNPLVGVPAARVSAARWVRKGVLDRQKAANELSAAIAKHIGGTLTGTAWDPRTGELKATFKRPSKLFPGLGLTENLQMTALISPERLGETDRAVVWTPSISGELADEAAGSRLSLVPLTLYAGPPEGILIYIEPETLAALLEAEWWDSANNTWTKR